MGERQGAPSHPAHPTVSPWGPMALLSSSSTSQRAPSLQPPSHVPYPEAVAPRPAFGHPLLLFIFPSCSIRQDLFSILKSPRGIREGTGVPLTLVALDEGTRLLLRGNSFLRWEGVCSPGLLSQTATGDVSLCWLLLLKRVFVASLLFLLFLSMCDELNNQHFFCSSLIHIIYCWKLVLGIS